MLIVKMPPAYEIERVYICKILLGEFLGLEYRLKFENRQDAVISGPNEAELHISDVFFQTPQFKWLTKDSLPTQPLVNWNISSIINPPPVVDPCVPVIFGKLQSDPTIFNPLPIDIFGSSFFMLTRYEEIVKAERDSFDRFPAEASLAYQEGFLDRPIVNEYVEILWWAMKSLWKGIERSRRIFRLFPTHDVDRPFKYALLNTKELMKKCLTESVKKKSTIMETDF